MKSFIKFLRYWAWRLTLMLAGLGLLAHIALWVLQDRLVFPRQKLTAVEFAAWQQRYPAWQQVYWTTPDGMRLHAWLRLAAQPAAPVLLYFGGNAESGPQVLERAVLPGRSMLVVDYRGYGVSGGEPSEAALKADALLAYDWLRADRRFGRIDVMGRSLGSGLAVYVASQRVVGHVVLSTPYDSIQAVAQRQYPCFWIGPLLRHPFDSLALAAKIRAPALFLLAEADTLIPPEPHAQRLFQAWGGAKVWQMLLGVNHHDVIDHPAYWSRVAAFLDGR